MGKRFEPRIDHKGMKYLFDQLNLNARKGIWVEFLYEYDFHFKHIKGKENKVVDALNKRVHELHATLSLACSHLINQETQFCGSSLRERVNHVYLIVFVVDVVLFVI
jgi:hypothetical protein